MQVITSKDNEQIKNIRKLKDKKYRQTMRRILYRRYQIARRSYCWKSKNKNNCNLWRMYRAKQYR